MKIRILLCLDAKIILKINDLVCHWSFVSSVRSFVEQCALYVTSPLVQKFLHRKYYCALVLAGG